MNKHLRQYLETAIWASVGFDEKPLKAGVVDCSESLVKQSEADLKLFLQKCEEQGLKKELKSDWPHDLWLTRNGHGAGFWDGDYQEEVGEALTEIAAEMGEVNLIECENGEIDSL